VPFLFLSCQHTSKIENKLSKNHEKHLNSPYVLLISLDGYRHDYTKMYKPKNITKFLNEGSSLTSLIPSYPTKTFPNHYTIVTGLYPENHGIVANSFHDPIKNRNYSLRDRKAVTDGSYYNGVPLWNLARQNEMVSATYFWPGSEANIGGVYPSYYRVYEHNTPHKKRIDTVIEWLKLPVQNRPHFTTLYFHDVDSAGHKYGPRSKQVKAAINKVDESLGQLFSQLEKLNIDLNIVLVSDHGMTALDNKKVIHIDKLLKTKEEIMDFSNFKIVGKGPIMHLYYQGPSSRKSKAITSLVKRINKGAKQHMAYSRNAIPKKYNFRKSSRIGDFIIKAKMGWSVGLSKSLKIKLGTHGYDQFEGKDMHGIFYAKGPQIKKGMELATKRNIHIYPFIAKILNLNYTHKIDGHFNKLAPLLK
jgi:alkaline phosphatase D